MPVADGHTDKQTEFIGPLSALSGVQKMIFINFVHSWSPKILSNILRTDPEKNNVKGLGPNLIYNVLYLPNVVLIHK